MSKPLSTQDIIRWLIYSLIVLIPSVYATGFESVFTVPKLTVFRVITLLIVAVWGLQVLSQGKIVYRKSPINKWILGYGVVLILTTITSTYFWTSFFGDQSRFLGLATMLNLLFLMGVVMVFFQNRHHVMSYTKISVWTSVVLSIYGLLQYKGLVGAESWSHDPTLRVFGTMGHSNHFGAYIAFHVMLLLGLLFIQKQNSQKMVYALAVIPMLLTILATASRGAFFSLMAALGIFTLGMIFRKWGWIKKQGKKVVGVGILAVIVLALFSGPIIQKVSELSLTQRTVSTIQFVQEGNVPDRVSWWFSVLAMTRDHPILGHGLATFHDVYNLYRRTDYRVPGDIQDTFTPETAHMEYLDIAATQGLLGLFMYLGLLFMWFRLLWKVMVSEESSLNAKILGLSFLCAGLVYFIQVLMSFGVIGTLVPLYMLMGMSATLYHVSADPKTQSEQFKTINLKGLTLAISTTVVVVLMFASGWYTYRQAAAEWTLDKAHDAEDVGEVAKMLEWYEKSVNHMPWMTRYWEAYGKSTFEFAGYATDLEIVNFLVKTSIDAYGNAYRLVQTLPHIQANLGISYLSYADVADAQGSSIQAKERLETGLAFYSEAVEVGVNNPLFAYNYGLILSSLDLDEEAWFAFLHVLDIRDPYLDTYYRLALASTELKDYENARLYVQKALAEDPSAEDVKALLQRINSETKVVEEAIE